jgi:DNA-binding GntR family transcriptional regulator
MTKKQTKRETEAPAESGVRERDVSTAVQSIVKALEEDVILGILHPRERLIEDELMSRFAAKRHVVRQALTELEHQGLVVRKRNTGAQVRALTAKEVIELYQVREILEISAIRLMRFPLRPAQIAALVSVQREHAAAVEQADPRAVFKANLDFHAALYALSGNDALADAIIEFARRTYPVRLTTLLSPDALKGARKDHDEIIRALRKGDAERLCEIAAAHLRPARDTYLKYLERLGLYERNAA